MQTSSSSEAAGRGGTHPKRIFIIAEMACSHEGKPELARKIIDGAGKAGADAIQFQIYSHQVRVAPSHGAYEEMKRIELSKAEWTDLAEYVRANYADMQIIACVYETDSADFAEEIAVDAYKLHSADLSNPGLVKHVAATGKRIDLSVGASTIAEIQMALEWIRGISDPEVWMMYGYQNFPTPTDAIHLDYMMKLRSLFDLTTGYQDHSDGDSDAAFWLPAVAAGMGIDVLEKHITHDRHVNGIDYQAALNPQEFDRFVRMVREIELAKGVSTPRPFSAEEQKYRVYAKKSLVAATDLASGTQITENYLLCLHTGEPGLPPVDADRLIGRKLTRDVAAYDLIRDEDVK